MTGHAEPGTRQAAQVLAELAQHAAREAVARVILRTAPGPRRPRRSAPPGRSSSPCTPRSSATSAGPGRRASRGPQSARCSASARSRPKGPARSPSSAFDYAAGPRTIDPGSRRRRCSGGTAPAAGGRIADHGPAKGPVADQDGHKDGCVRLAAEAADWDQEAPR